MTALSMKVAPSRVPAALIVGILLMAGCAGFERSPKVEAAPVVPTSAAVPTEAPPALAAPPAAAVAPGPVPLPTTERGIAAPGPAVSSATQVDAASKRQPASTLPASTPKAPAKPASAPQTAAQGPKTLAAPAPAPVAAPAKAEAPPSLDLKSLETRLKETKAIGVFTKLALKNQIDELLDQFRSHYQGRTKTSLAELRRSFDRLVLKTLALLQDTDPPLASAIASSRESIWGILSDPKKFAAV